MRRGRHHGHAAKKPKTRARSRKGASAAKDFRYVDEEEFTLSCRERLAYHYTNEDKDCPAPQWTNAWPYLRADGSVHEGTADAA